MSIHIESSAGPASSSKTCALGSGRRFLAILVSPLGESWHSAAGHQRGGRGWQSHGRCWLAARHHDAPRDARTVRLHTRRLRMPERQRMTTRLKTLFQRPALFVLAGGINPIGAKMAEALGYDAFYMSGGNT